MTKHHTPPSRRPSLPERILLWPGNAVCDLFRVPKNADHRMLLRLWINLIIYTKIAGLIAYAVY